MRIIVIVLLFLVGCSGIRCPEGFVSARINGSSACISSVSYCISDGQCSSARFDCARPCAHLPVNILFSALAHEKADSCNRSSVSCKQVPFVDNRCVKNQCVSVPHTADELIPLPAFLEVAPGMSACFDRKGSDSVLRLSVLNNASVPLQQLEAYLNLSLRNGSWVMAKDVLLNESLAPYASVNISRKLVNATPKEVHIFAVRPVNGSQVTVGVVNQDTVASIRLAACSAKVE